MHKHTNRKIQSICSVVSGPQSRICFPFESFGWKTQPTEGKTEIQ